MFAPAHIDGRTLVVLKRSGRMIGRQFDVVASGELWFDGETLTLVGEDSREFVIAEEEWNHILPVNQDSRIGDCAGFDFFILRDTGSK